VKIRIINWQKYNPRNDYKTMPWIRFQTDFFFSETAFELSNDERLIWIFLLTLGGRKNSEIISCGNEYIGSMTRVKPSVVEKALKKLESLQCIEIVRTSGERVTNVPRSCPVRYVTKGNVRDETKRNKISLAALARIYDKYPLKRGKGAGLKKLQATIKTEEDLKNLSVATDRCIEHHEKQLARLA
jgi:hypothetical protein